MARFGKLCAETRQKEIPTTGMSPGHRATKIPRMAAKKRNPIGQEQQTKMVDDKLERDEAQRAANYEAIKSGVKADVGGEIQAEAARPELSQAERVEEVADGMRRSAVSEVV